MTSTLHVLRVNDKTNVVYRQEMFTPYGSLFDLPQAHASASTL
jgi:hypothetical protein